jgi:hypothetical protein
MHGCSEIASEAQVSSDTGEGCFLPGQQCLGAGRSQNSHCLTQAAPTLP